MRTLTCWSLLPAGLLLAAPIGAQNVPTRTFSKPDAEFSEPFTTVSGIRELKDGRVVAIDSRDKIVEIVDFRTNSATKIGREGSGPGEYALPMSLVALPGDSSGVYDVLNRRMLAILPDGKAGDFIQMPSGGGGRGMVVMGSGPRGTDRLGRFYTQGPPISMGPSGPVAADSSPIERLDRRTSKRDTLAWLHLPKNSSQVSGSGGRMSIRMGAPNPFAPQDQWAVAPDGRIALVSAEDYHIDWVSPDGRRTRTPPIRFDRLKVSERHKQEWRDRMKQSTGIMMTNNNGKMSATQVPMNNVPEPDEWPEYMPPFLNNAVSFAQDGTLWVQRTTPAGQPPTFDLIDGAGKVVQRVTLQQKSRLAGFGNGTVYVARVDEDDLQYLQRYRFMAPDRP
jgi:hypothetical protein